MVTDALYLDMAMRDIAPEPACTAVPVGEHASWLARRALRLTASDVAVAMAVLDELDASRLTQDKQRAAAKVRDHRGGHGLPMIVARKAGLRRALAERADVAGYRETELLAQWTGHLRTVRSGPLSRIDPDSVRHASEVPGEWMPLRDPECDDLAASPDGWAREHFDGALVTIDCKRTGSRQSPVRESWYPQITAQCACTGARWGVLVVGVGWALGPEVRGEIESYVVEPRADEIARVRDVARRFMDLVRKARREHCNG